MNIEIDDVGKEFYNELLKLINIRINKRKIYQDTYLEDTPDFLISQIENKLKRIKLHLRNKTEINDIEKAEDNAIDIAVYSLFLSNNLKR